MDIRKQFSGVEPEKLEKAIAAAEKKAKPIKSQTFEMVKPGDYNAIVLPVAPHAIAQVTDAGKSKLVCELVGQQVVASRPFVAPVSVQYVTRAEHERWHAEVAAEVRRLVE